MLGSSLDAHYNNATDLCWRCVTGGDAERGTLGQSHMGHAALGGSAAPTQACTDRQSLD